MAKPRPPIKGAGLEPCELSGYALSLHAWMVRLVSLHKRGDELAELVKLRLVGDAQIVQILCAHEQRNVCVKVGKSLALARLASSLCALALRRDSADELREG